MFNTLKTENQLNVLRKRWVEAKLKGDLVLMNLFEKLGKKLKEQLKSEENSSYKFAEKIFLENEQLP